jgi:aminoglycoside phosphotransferase (APT) family kinase protein
MPAVLALERQPFPANHDAVAMRQLFETHSASLFGMPVVIEQYDIADSYYKTYRKATSRHKDFQSTCYRLLVRDPRADSPRTTYVCTRAFHAGQSAIAYATLKNLNECAVHFAEHDTVAWRFQTDWKLPQLAGLLDSECVRDHLPYHALPAHLQCSEEIARIDIDVVNYRPEQRCVVRYTLHHRSNDPARSFVLYGKTFADDLAHQVFQRLNHGWRMTHANAGDLQVARPLACDAVERTVWTEAVAGATVAAMIDDPSGNERFARAARALAELHRMQMPFVDAAITRHDLLTEAQKKCVKLARSSTLFAPLLDHVSRRLEASLPCLVPETVSLIHGDCHARQFIGGDGFVALLDFDELGHGDAAQDVASFLVDLQLQTASASRARQLICVFLAAYQSRVAHAPPVASLLWHTVVQLVNKAYRAYLRQGAGLSLELAHIQRLLRRDLRLMQKALLISAENRQ